MRNKPMPMLLFPVMVLLAPACMGQARDPAPPGPARPEAAPRSAFGQVMEVMIDALRQQARVSTDTGNRAHEVRTTASGTPLGIEVGGAFRLDDPPATDAAMPLAAQSGE